MLRGTAVLLISAQQLLLVCNALPRATWTGTEMQHLSLGSGSRSMLAASDDRAASWQPFANYLSTKGVETLYNCGFESVATACPEVESDLVPERGYGAASDLLVPPGEHVLLIGSSHMRSIAEVIMAAHRFSNDEPKILHVHDSDDCVLNQTEAEARQWSQTHTGHDSTCGLYDGLWEGQKRAGNNVACKRSDHYTARFPSGAALTVTANYAN